MSHSKERRPASPVNVIGVPDGDGTPSLRQHCQASPSLSTYPPLGDPTELVADAERAVPDAGGGGTKTGRPQVKLIRSKPLRLPPHPGSAPSDWRSWALCQQKPLAVDLFAGCGGLSLGLEQAGYSVALAVDQDPWAIETHQHNIPGTVQNLDLGDEEHVSELIALLQDVPVDLVAGGPPCQPFSRAGRSKIRSLVNEGHRDPTDARARLWESFIRVVREIRPTAALMENVPDMALGDDFATVREITAELTDAGYDVHTRFVDAWRFGVPQHRQRFILVALREGRAFKWPEGCEEQVTLREAIGDLPRLGSTTGCSELPARAPEHPFQKRARHGMEDRHLVWDHLTRPVRDDDREAFRLMTPGTRYADLPAEHRRYRSDIFDDKYNRLCWDGLSRSITAHIAKDGYWYIHPEEHRTLTVREAARIQTFPDRFRFAGTRTNAFTQIGNAVPPALAEAIGCRVLAAARHQPTLPVERRSHRLAQIRRALVDWAEHDRRERPWYHAGELWPAAVGAVLAPRSLSDERFVESLLRSCPSPTAVDEYRLATLGRTAGKRMAAELPTLATVARHLTSSSADAGSWIEKCGLSNTQKMRLRTLAFGENVLLSSTQALRVVKRVLGVSEITLNRSGERLHLGELVGNGPDVPTLNGALTTLGTLVCTASEPLCADCHLQKLQLCRSYQSNLQS